MPRDRTGECGLAVLGFIAYGIFYIVSSNTFDGEYTGTLIRTDKYYNRNWYVKEIFQKGNTTNTCSVIRSKGYSTVHEVNDAKDKVILGTTRKIWSYWHNQHSCYDQTIKDSDQTTGIVFLCIMLGIPLLIVLFILLVRAGEELSHLHCNCNCSCNCFSWFSYGRTATQEAVAEATLGSVKVATAEVELTATPQDLERGGVRDLEAVQVAIQM
jgi:hypothetical protein